MKAFDINEHKEDFEKLDAYMEEVGKERGNLMSILHHAQEMFGYLPLEVQEFISEKTEVPLADIYGVVTFYSNFSTEAKGKYEIGCCLGTACYVRGGQAVADEFMKELGIEIGSTTEDGMYSLNPTRCIGACGLAPVCTINGDVYGNLVPGDVKEILAKYK